VLKTLENWANIDVSKLFSIIICKKSGRYCILFTIKPRIALYK
jgi:hypothetical protein